jgi:hypothetical protein
LLWVYTRRQSLLLEQLFIHFPLDNHERSINERSLKQLALEHPYQVINALVLVRVRPLLILSARRHQLVWGQLTTLSSWCGAVCDGELHVIPDDLGTFTQCILTVLAVDAFVVKFNCGGLELMQHFEHVFICNLA